MVEHGRHLAEKNAEARFDVSRRTETQDWVRQGKQMAMTEEAPRRLRGGWGGQNIRPPPNWGAASGESVRRFNAHESSISVAVWNSRWVAVQNCSARLGV